MDLTLIEGVRLMIDSTWSNCVSESVKRQFIDADHSSAVDRHKKSSLISYTETYRSLKHSALPSDFTASPYFLPMNSLG